MSHSAIQIAGSAKSIFEAWRAIKDVTVRTSSARQGQPGPGSIDKNSVARESQ